MRIFARLWRFVRTTVRFRRQAKAERDALGLIVARRDERLARDVGLTLYAAENLDPSRAQRGRGARPEEPY
jgi:hypothetical protein